jgi:phosphatidate cytidylyltransferase
MLKQRVITALILVPAVVLLVLFAPTNLLALVTAGVLLLGALEWSRLSGCASPAGRTLYLLVTTVLMVAAEWLRREQIAADIYLAAALWWLVVLGMLVRLRQTGGGSEQGVSLATAVAGQLVLVPAWLALVALHAREPAGPGLLLFLLVMIWLADTGAYFAGRRWGKTRLAPGISPGKTWEGVGGAVAAMVLSSLLLYHWGVLAGVAWPAVLLLCLLAGCFSIVGDLFESLVKRRRGVKDSGNLLPGHGGVLDRIDSLTAAAPVFLFALTVMGAL